MYKQGEIIRIRNNAGILPIKLIHEANLPDIGRGIGEDRLPEMKCPRLEIHKHYDTTLVTICDGKAKVPFDIWAIVIEPYEKPVAFLGRCDTSEVSEDIFETCE